MAQPIIFSPLKWSAKMDGMELSRVNRYIFKIGKLQSNPMGLEPMASPSIPLLWEEEVPIELSSLEKLNRLQSAMSYILVW